MSTLSQFTGGGSSIPMGSLTSQYDYSTKPLIDTPQGVYIKAGAAVISAPASTLAKVKSAGLGYAVPGSACALGNGAANSIVQGIVFGGGVYLRTSRNTLLRSSDGITWTTVALPQLRVNSIFGIVAPPVYFSGKWIMLAQGNSSIYAVDVLNSTDGLTWSVVRTLTYSISNGGAFISIANSVLYISTSAYYPSQAQADIYYSNDGSTFRPCVLPTGYTGYITAVTWSGSVYFAAGTNTSSGLISTDGITWTTQSHSTIATTLFYVNNLFILSSPTVLYTSPAAGTTWTARTNPQAATIISVVFAAGLYVAGTTAGVITSPDGVTWTSRTAGTNVNVVFDGTTFVAAGTGTVYTSTDGITWTSRTIPYTAATTSSSSSRILNDGTTKWVIDGVGSIQKSTDGTTWTRVLSCSPATNAAANTYAMKLVNGFVFYLPTTGGIQATPSSTGTDWSIKFNSTIVFSDITFASGLYVAVGAGGAVYTSTDLATWTSRSAGASIHNVVCFGNNMFVTAGTYAGAYSSPDGITWTLRSTMAGTTSKFADYKNGQFIIGSGAYFYASPDGITWVSLNLGPQLYTRTVGDVIITYGGSNGGAYIINGSKALYYGNGAFTCNVVGYSTVTDTYYIVSNVSTVYYFVGLPALLQPTASTAGPSNPGTASAPGIHADITPYIFTETPGSLTTMFIGGNGNGLSVNGGYFFSTGVSSFNGGYITQASTAISTADYMLVSDSASLYYYKKDGITSNTVLLGSSTYGISPTAGYTAFYRRVG